MLHSPHASRLQCVRPTAANMVFQNRKTVKFGKPKGSKWTGFPWAQTCASCGNLLWHMVKGNQHYTHQFGASTSQWVKLEIHLRSVHLAKARQDAANSPNSSFHTFTLSHFHRKFRPPPQGSALVQLPGVRVQISINPIEINSSTPLLT